MEQTKKTITDYPYIANLTEKYFSDSKSESEKAEMELIKICEPIIKKYCKTIEKYIEQIGGDFSLRDKYFDKDYSCTRRSICTFIKYDEKHGVFEFWYNEGCIDELYCVYMPIEWLDKDKFYDNIMVIKHDIREHLIEQINNKIAEHEKTLTRLRKQDDNLKTV